MRLTPKERLIKQFLDAHELGTRYYCMAIKAPGATKRELIINPIENIEAKLKYVEGAYNDELKLKANNEIQITGFMADNSIAFIEECMRYTCL